MLADHTTLGLGGPAKAFHTATTTDDLVRLVTDADRAGERVLVLGGGSNLVIADDGFPGTVILVASSGVTLTETGTDPETGEDVVLLRADAGVEWDPLVERTVAEGLNGIEFLSGIPGRVGSTPIQNVGAYGQDVAQTIREVLVLDRATGELVTMSNADCGFTYRDSVFKGGDRHVVCEVVFELRRGPLSRPVRYAEVARTMGVDAGERVALEKAREVVLGLRAGKGMVLDPDDPDTRSAGSFFTNPILSPVEYAAFRERAAARLGPDTAIPGHPDDQGNVKLSAAWLIDRAGFTKGYGDGPARISGKHTLALTNPGGAATADLLDLAREVRAGVEDAFGVRLVNEPVMVGVCL
ncbi:UDP-N-acetylmuramate dehydrogenase [Nocardiopsis sp. MG754419]|uniref:UDP-N-acetylmuramate dehydrogenase n=1 Tax=Nocardiopsis sp. MG754419 TaxID=2259865 RepID=UPI001BAA0569|nr:UDP-N-acetylmuramate dehydrogenase [Nocardiopsis sp. MG754419]